MRSFPLNEIAQEAGGKLFAPPEAISIEIKNISTDSRTFHRGEPTLFVALKGPVHDAHQYIPALIKKGVQAFLVDDSSMISNEAAFILVENTTRALQRLAAFNRLQFICPVVGITGSNGKTIVKEWLNELLSETKKIVRSPKSYNSQVGVPLSVFLMNESHSLGIFEAGISQPGEMKHLQPVIAPTIGILTNIGDAHQEFFRSLEEKLEEKLLLFRHSKKLIFRIDSEHIRTKTSEFCQANDVEAFSWSTLGYEAVIQFSVVENKDESIITARHGNYKNQFKIPFSDDSAIENACHCYATIVALDLDPRYFLPNFERLQPIAMRLEIKRGINDCLLINDFYNSDLNSLGIALSVLNQQAASVQRKKMVILSDIRQTGIPQQQLYEKVSKLFLDWGIDFLIGIGPELFAWQNEFNMPARFFRSFEEFAKQFSRNDFQSASILIKGARQFRFERISGLLQQKAHQTVLEINVNALIQNLNTFRKLLQPETKIMVMVKAFSYGSGDVEIARVLQNQNINYLAVAVADEGVQIRNAGINVPIIVMNPERESFPNIIDFGLEPNIYSLELLQSFADHLEKTGIENYPAHLKIDTGMNRLGFKATEEIESALHLLKSSGRINIRSVFSHLAGSDEEALDDFTASQFERFETAFSLISQNLRYPIDRHILNSAGIERFSEKQFEMVRLGIGLYGVSVTGLPLASIGTLKSTVSQVKKVTEDETVGYNRNGKLRGESTIAIVPVGYADGLNRKLGNGIGEAFVNGKRVPIVGNICMDMLMLNVTGVDVKAGDSVEFFGPNISVTEVAQKIGTIPYEILTGISQRVKRVYLQE